MNLTRIANILFICFIASTTLQLSLAAPMRDPDLDDDSDIDLGDTSDLPGEESRDDPSTSYEDSYGDDSYGDDSYGDDSYGDDYAFESYICGDQDVQIEQLCDRVRDCDDGSDELLETCLAHGREIDNEDDFTSPWMEPTEVATTIAPANTQQVETTGESEERNAGTGDYDSYYDDNFDYESCLEDEYQCSDSICISRAAICDGLYDCDDGADEENCHGNQEETTLHLPNVMTVTTTKSSIRRTFGYTTTPQMTTAAQVATTTAAPLIKDHTDDTGSADYTQESSDADETTKTWRPQETTGQVTATTHVDTTITSEDTRKTGYKTSTSRTVSTTKVISPETTTTIPVVTQQTETISSSTFTTEPTSLRAITPEHPTLATTETNHKYATTTDVMTNNAPTTTFPTTTTKSIPTTTATVATTYRIPESTFTESISSTPIIPTTAGYQSISSDIQAASNDPDLCTGKDRFQCRSRVGDCISRDMMCDGFIDCDDGSDEADCSCKRGSDFECISNRCIDAALRCDGYDDCGDMSDEIIGCIVDPGIRILTRPEVTQTTENHANQTNTQTSTQATTTPPIASTSSTTESHAEPGMSVITFCPSGYSCFNGGTCSWSSRGEETCQCPERFTGNYCERVVVEGDLEKNIDIPCGSATSVRLNSLQRFMLILVILLSVAINCGVNVL